MLHIGHQEEEIVENNVLKDQQILEQFSKLNLELSLSPESVLPPSSSIPSKSYKKSLNPLFSKPLNSLMKTKLKVGTRTAPKVLFRHHKRKLSCLCCSSIVISCQDFNSCLIEDVVKEAEDCIASSTSVKTSSTSISDYSCKGLCSVKPIIPPLSLSMRNSILIAGRFGDLSPSKIRQNHSRNHTLKSSINSHAGIQKTASINSHAGIQKTVHGPRTKRLSKKRIKRRDPFFEGQLDELAGLFDSVSMENH